MNDQPNIVSRKSQLSRSFLAAVATAIAAGFVLASCGTPPVEENSAVGTAPDRTADHAEFDRARAISRDVASALGGTIGDYQLAATSGDAPTSERLVQFLNIGEASDLSIDTEILRTANAGKKALARADRNCGADCRQISAAPGAGRWLTEVSGESELLIVQEDGSNVSVTVTISGRPSVTSNLGGSNIPAAALTVA
jgi:hypothetical protein